MDNIRRGFGSVSIHADGAVGAADQLLLAAVSGRHAVIDSLVLSAATNMSALIEDTAPTTLMGPLRCLAGDTVSFYDVRRKSVNVGLAIRADVTSVGAWSIDGEGHYE